MRLPMRTWLTGLMMLTALSACDPYKQKFQSFVDHDIRDVEEFYGPVWDAYDRPDGLRYFQWGRTGPYVRPPVPVENLAARSYGNSPLYNPATVLSYQNAHHLRCWYTVGARWHDDTASWMVEEVRLPAERCEP